MSASRSGYRDPCVAASLGVGVIGLSALALGPHTQADVIYQSYLAAFVFWTGLSLGALAIVMVGHVGRGNWAERLGPVLEVAGGNVLLMAIAALPLLGALDRLYPWTTSDSAQSWYLNTPFFVLRTAVSFAIWCALALLLVVARRRGETGRRHQQQVSIAGLIIYAFTVTVFAVDWVSSLVPQFASSVFGLRVAASQMLAATAFGVLCVGVSRRRLPAADAGAGPYAFGKLLLSLVLAWAYLALVEFVTVWVADLPRETAWYLPRMQPNWRLTALVLVLLEFALPFACLLSRAVKTSTRALGFIAGALLAASVIDAFWLVVPSLRSNGATYTWTDLYAFAGIGGGWLAAFFWRFDTGARPTREERLKEAVDGRDYAEAGGA